MGQLLNDRNKDYKIATKILNKHVHLLKEDEKHKAYTCLCKLPFVRREHDKLTNEIFNFMNAENEFITKTKGSNISKESVIVILTSLKHNINVWERERLKFARKIRACENYLRKKKINATWYGHI